MKNTKVELGMHTLNLNWIDVTLAYFKKEVHVLSETYKCML